jgi:hypothetical protein
MSALAATLTMLAGNELGTPGSGALSPTSFVDSARNGAARQFPAKRAMRRRTMDSQARSDHLSELTAVSKRPTNSIFSPASESRRAISKATSPPKE